MIQILLLTAFGLLSGALALYKDEAGVIDWNHRLVGQVGTVNFHPASKSALLTNEKLGILASVGLSGTGNIDWRVVLPESEVHLASSPLPTTSSDVLVLSKSAEVTYLRLFKAGSLVWQDETTFDASEYLAGGSPFVQVAGSAVFFGTGGSSVAKISLETGSKDWLIKSSSLERVFELRVLRDGGKLALFGLSRSGKFIVQTLSQLDGTATSEFPFNAQISQKSILAPANTLENAVFAWSEDGYVYVISFAGEIPEFGYARASAFVASEIYALRFVKTGHEVSLVIFANSETAFTKVSVKAETVLTKSYAVKNGVQVYTTGQEVVQAEAQGGGVVSLSALDASGSIKQLFALKTTSPLDNAKIYVTGEYALLETIDQAVTLFHKGVLVWIREESLASIVAVENVELPEKFQLRSHYFAEAGVSPLAAYKNRWASHFASLSLLFGGHESSKIFSNDSSGSADALIADKFGFKHLLIIATTAGKLVALDTEKGHVAWSHFVADFKPRHMTLTRSVHSGEFPSVLVVGQSSKRGIVAVEFNALTGKVINEIAQPGKLEHFVEFQMQTNYKGVAIVNQDLTVSTYPIAAAVKQVLLSKDVHTFTVDREHSTMVGYAFVENAKQEVVKLRQVWQLQFGKSEKIEAVSKKPSGTVASIGKVLPDRSVLFKYLNPNAISVATTSTKKGGNQATKVLTVYLVDTFNGAILNQVAHDNAISTAANIQLVQAENWVVYSFLAKHPLVRKDGTFELLPQLNVLEFFETGVPDQRLDMKEFSSYRGLKPNMTSQSYQFQTDLRALAVTETLKGITARELVYASATFSVGVLPKKLLDPFRPYKPVSALTSEEKEEGVIPYGPVLEHNPKQVVSYTLELTGINNVFTFPAALESTSLILAYGHDLFFTRRMPSKAFDHLDEQFNRPMLLAVLAGLSLAIGLTRHYGKLKKLNNDWK